MMDNEFRRRRIVRRIALSWPVVGLVGIITLLLGISTLRLYLRHRPLAQARSALQEEVRRTRERTAALQERLEHLQTPAGKEEMLRERFNVRRPGEEVLVIVRESDFTEQVASPSPFSPARIFAIIRNWLGL